jgi:phosphatidylglycerophosphate synthase
MQQATPSGARLDSVADAAVYLTAPIAAVLLYPALWAQERYTAFVVIAAYAIPIAIGFAKYRRLTAYHTLAARLAGLLIGVAFVCFVLLHITWPFRVAAVVLALSALEELVLTFTLPQWRANVPSWLHVRRGGP